MSVCLVDTSVLCELLEVPNLCSLSDDIAAELEAKVKRRESLLLPVGCIIETGNHIAQNGDGRLRRETARRFVRLVRQAIQGDSPFTPTPFFEPDALLEWIDDFPAWAMRGSGLADLTIVKEFDRQCQLNRARRVYIWSLDVHLSSHDRAPHLR